MAKYEDSTQDHNQNADTSAVAVALNILEKLNIVPEGKTVGEDGMNCLPPTNLKLRGLQEAKERISSIEATTNIFLVDGLDTITPKEEKVRWNNSSITDLLSPPKRTYAREKIFKGKDLDYVLQKAVLAYESTSAIAKRETNLLPERRKKSIATSPFCHIQTTFGVAHDKVRPKPPGSLSTYQKIVRHQHGFPVKRIQNKRLAGRLCPSSTPSVVSRQVYSPRAGRHILRGTRNSLRQVHEGRRKSPHSIKRSKVAQNVRAASRIYAESAKKERIVYATLKRKKARLYEKYNHGGFVYYSKSNLRDEEDM